MSSIELGDVDDAVVYAATGVIDLRDHQTATRGAQRTTLRAVPRAEPTDASVGDRARRLAKGALDRTLALVALLVLSPLLLVVALAVKLTSPGGVLFHQVRIGQDGRPFRFVKFRTMVEDAEDLLIDLRDQNECDGVLFKIRNDPRMTTVGRWLRRFSIDELPQIWNVLKGDMSLVGPRPALPDEVAAYDPLTERRLAVKPGLTGLWQVSGRADLEWAEAVRLDLHYVENWSLALDLQILAKTVPAVLTGRGAY